MRWRLEYEAANGGWRYRSTARSYSSAWRALQRVAAREPDTSLRILQERPGGSHWEVVARAEHGELVEWHGRAVS
jgi:hypothetical protein